MSLNGINSTTSNYSNYDTSGKTPIKKNDNTAGSAQTPSENEAAAVYESSKNLATDSSAYTAKNSALIEQLKADTNNRIAQMQSLVQKMFEQQGVKIGTADDMWKALASGNFTADADTVAQAKDDISENGYWGVAQTSERIFSFAKALTGGDESKMKEMKEAVKKGFSEATKAWGKELPSISSNTYDAVMKKFDDFFGSDSTSDSTETEA